MRGAFATVTSQWTILEEGWPTFASEVREAKRKEQHLGKRIYS